MRSDEMPEEVADRVARFFVECVRENDEREQQEQQAS